jgi:amino-acid N-acetyltransferase
MNKIQNAHLNDAKKIQELINTCAKQDLLLARSLNEIYENIRDFYIYKDNNNITACGALHIVWEDLAELRSLIVEESARNSGIGKLIVEHIINEAKKLGITKIFTLTYQDKFFKKIGFEYIDKEMLPHKIWSDCIKCVKFPNCDEIAMMYTIK